MTQTGQKVGKEKIINLRTPSKSPLKRLHHTGPHLTVTPTHLTLKTPQMFPASSVSPRVPLHVAIRYHKFTITKCQN